MAVKLALIAALAALQGAYAQFDDDGALTTCETKSELSDRECKAVVSDFFTLHWTLNPVPQTEQIWVTGECASEGWCAFGFSSNENMPSSEVAMRSGSDLGAYSIPNYGGPAADASQTLLSLAEATVDGVTSISFLRDFDNGGSIAVSAGDNTVIWGVGNDDDDTVTQHDNEKKGLASVNLETGEVTVITDDDVVVHGVLMIVAWGVLLPTGILVARYGKGKDGKGKQWFMAHRALQTMGLVVGTSGVALAIATQEPFDSGHGALGLVVTVLAWLQPLNAALRPHKDASAAQQTKARRMWEFAHKNLGRLAQLLAYLVMFMGLKLLDDEPGQETATKTLRSVFMAFLLTFVGNVVVREVMVWRKGSAQVTAA